MVANERDKKLHESAAKPVAVRGLAFFDAGTQLGQLETKGNKAGVSGTKKTTILTIPAQLAWICRR